MLNAPFGAARLGLRPPAPAPRMGRRLDCWVGVAMAGTAAAAGTAGTASRGSSFTAARAAAPWPAAAAAAGAAAPEPALLPAAARAGGCPGTAPPAATAAPCAPAAAAATACWAAAAAGGAGMGCAVAPIICATTSRAPASGQSRVATLQAAAGAVHSSHGQSKRARERNYTSAPVQSVLHPIRLGTTQSRQCCCLTQAKAATALFKQTCPTSPGAHPMRPCACGNTARAV